MSSWEEEDKSKELILPPNALPGLRDLKVQFVALIYFDPFLGPVDYIAELSRGSSYIQKLRDYSTLSEVYAGVARSDIDTQTTLEDNITISRYFPSDQEDTPYVLLISCMPNADLSSIREIGQKALFRSQGNPEELGEQLGIAIREYQASDIRFQSETAEKEIKVLEDKRIKKPFEFENIKGFLVYDLESSLADFRFLPIEVFGKKINPEKFLRFLDNQISSIEENSVTSILYQSIPMIATKVRQKNIFLIMLIDMSDISKLQKIEEWIHIYATCLAREWKFCNIDELALSIEVLNEGINRNMIPEFIEKYLQLALRCKRIYPSLLNHSMLEIDPPDYISEMGYSILENMDGKNSIFEIYSQNGTTLLELLILIEWAIARNLVGLLQD